MLDCEMTRRGVLRAGAAFTAWAGLPRLARAGSRDPRLLVLVLRGGLDGLATVAPVGDPTYEMARHGLTLPEGGTLAGIPLDGFFVLNARLPQVSRLYERGEALFVHATATPYRGRSHFSGQAVLENGTESDSHHQDGWLGRALSALPVDEEIGSRTGFAAASTIPLTMKGKARVVTWMLPGFNPASGDTRLRLLKLYRHTDPELSAVLARGLHAETVVGTEPEMLAAVEGDLEGSVFRGRGITPDMIAVIAGRAMAADDGPRVGFLDIIGYDTHRAQKAVEGAFGRQLSILDDTIAALERSLGPVWRDTAVLAITEFGRTVAINGSRGTDHGTAGVAMLLGGAVRGGRVLADWPGLRESDLFEGRDLRPTTDLRALAKGVLRDHLGLGERPLANTVFPESRGIRPLDGLIA